MKVQYRWCTIMTETTNGRNLKRKKVHIGRRLLMVGRFIFRTLTGYSIFVINLTMEEMGLFSCLSKAKCNSDMVDQLVYYKV